MADFRSLMSRFFVLSSVALASCSAHVDYIKTLKLPTEVVDSVASQPGAPRLLKRKKPIRVTPGRCLRQERYPDQVHFQTDTQTGQMRSYRTPGHYHCVGWSKPIYHGLGGRPILQDDMHRHLRPVANFLESEADSVNRINQLRYDEADSMLTVRSVLVSLAIVLAGGGMVGGGFAVDDPDTQLGLWIAGGGVGFVGLLTGIFMGILASPDSYPPNIGSNLPACITAWNCAVRPSDDCPTD